MTRKEAIKKLNELWRETNKSWYLVLAIILLNCSMKEWWAIQRTMQTICMKGDKNEKNRGDHADYNNNTFIRMR